MRTARLYRYQLPMDSGVILRDQRLDLRHGFIVELCQNGVSGFGEIAPLPEFSQETIEDAKIQLHQWLKAWVQYDYTTKQIDDAILYPSVACGLSFALSELSQILPKGQSAVTGAQLCSGDPDELILELILSNHKLVKMKVGQYEAVRDGVITNLFLESISDLTLRLDANRGWTLAKTEQFSKYVPFILRHRVDFIEEPCLLPEDSLSFAAKHRFKIAWDESLRERGDSFLSTQFMDPKLVNAVIIKPMLTGSIFKCLSIIEKAAGFGIKSVISSSIESSFGLTQLAQLAQWLTPQVPFGLDTVQFFKAQLERPWLGSPLPIVSLSELDVDSF